MLNQYQTTPEIYRLINHSALLDQQTDLFYDEIHVNKKGRRRATEEFVKTMKR
jgi:hypothetical protein